MSNNKEKYYKISVDLYTHVIINDFEIKNIKNKYEKKTNLYGKILLEDN